MKTFALKDGLMIGLCALVFIMGPRIFLSPVLAADGEGLYWDNTIEASSIRVMSRDANGSRYVTTLLSGSTRWLPEVSGLYFIQLVTDGDAEDWPISNAVHWVVETEGPNLPEQDDAPVDDPLIISRAEA